MALSLVMTPSSQPGRAGRARVPATVREDGAMTDVRHATEADLPAIKAIYDEEVRHGVSTFTIEPPGLDYWRERLESTHPGDHVLVATDGDAVLGYAYSGSYRPREAYARTRETSVYLADSARGRGVGRRLYDDLLALMAGDGVHLVVAVVAVPNPASQALHVACGFTRVGVLHEVGFKLGRWIDTELWELRLR
jgi:L-amino acid N-acyltransferase YncA